MNLEQANERVLTPAPMKKTDWDTFQEQIAAKRKDANVD